MMRLRPLAHMHYDTLLALVHFLQVQSELKVLVNDGVPFEDSFLHKLSDLMFDD
jgi:hypothetical protein